MASSRPPAWTTGRLDAAAQIDKSHKLQNPVLEMYEEVNAIVRCDQHWVRLTDCDATPSESGFPDEIDSPEEECRSMASTMLHVGIGSVGSVGSGSRDAVASSASSSSS